MRGLIQQIVRAILTIGAGTVICIMYLRGEDPPESLRLITATLIGTYYKEVSSLKKNGKNGA